MYLDAKKILAELNDEDIIKICESLGCTEYKRDAKNNLCFSTALCHGGDSPYKLVYYNQSEDNKENKFHCYTCGDTYSVTELVIRAKRLQGTSMTWYKALHYIGQITGKLIESVPTKVETTEVIDFSWINNLQRVINRKTRDIPNLKGIDEHVLEVFCYIPHETWLNDNISREAMSRYEIGYYPVTDQIVIPHRDINSNLIGIRGRFLSQEDMEKGKYMPMVINGNQYNHSLGNNLYGLYIAKEAINKKKKIMLVEAEKSCLQSYSYYGEDSFAVALCGSNITATQIKIILNQVEVNEVILALDKEYTDPHSWDAEIYYNKCVMKLAPLVPYVKCTLLIDTEGLLDFKDSPTDKGKEVLERLMDNKIVIDLDEVNHVESEMKK